MANETKRTMNTRISLKIDTWANWHDTAKGANLILARGEVAFVQIGSIPPGTDNQVIDTVLFKVGDGTSKFSELQWGSAMAADVYDWAKVDEEAFYKKLTGKDKVTCEETFVTTEDFDKAITNITDTTKDGTIANKVKKLEDAVDITKLSVASGKDKTVQNAIDKAKSDLIGNTTPTVSDMGAITSITSDAPNTITGAKQYAIDVVKALLNAYILDEANGGSSDAIDKLVEIANWIDSDKNGAADIILELEKKQNTADFNKWLTDVFATVNNNSHTHSNKAILDTYDQTNDNIKDAVSKKHSHSNKAELDKVADGDVAKWNGKLDESTFNQWKTNSFTPVSDAKHTHSNKAILDTYTQTEANLADAVSKKHEHSNATVLNGIKSTDITNWNGKLDESTFNSWKTSDFKPVSDAKHTHNNKGLLDEYTQSDADISDAVDKKHSHTNKTVLDGIKATDITNWDGKLDESEFSSWKTSTFSPVSAKAHSHTSSLADIESAVAQKHTHTYTATDSQIQDAVGKKHSHENADVLDGLTEDEVASWNATAANAFTEANVFYINCGTATENAFLIS